MPPTKGGVTTFMLNLMASPLGSAFTFVPFTTSRPPKKNVTDNWGYRAMLRGGLRRMISGAAITAWHLGSFPIAVMARGIDIVQIQACDYQVFWESALYAAMARVMGRPVLLRIGGAFDIFHGQASAMEQRLIAMVLQWPDVVIAQSVFARNYIRHAGRRGDIVLLPNWSAIPDAMLADRPATHMPVCLFIAGQEAHRKGIEEVLQAAALLKAQGCSVRFHLVAVPPPLMARITALDVGGSMEMEGPAAHGRVLELMRQSDIFLLPSHGEGFPNALVEAMAAGMACIATPVGAVPEMAEGGAVLTVPVGNPASLASAIATLANDAALRHRMATQAQVTVRTRYVAATVLPDLANSYRQVLEQNPTNLSRRGFPTRR